MDNEALFVFFKELVRGFAGVISCSILNEDHFARDLRKQVQQKGFVTINTFANYWLGIG